MDALARTTRPHIDEVVNFMIQVLRGEPLGGDNGAPTDADRKHAARWLAQRAALWVTDDALLAALTPQERAAVRTRVLMRQLLEALEHEEALARVPPPKPAAPPTTRPG